MYTCLTRLSLDICVNTHSERSPISEAGKYRQGVCWNNVIRPFPHEEELDMLMIPGDEY